MLFTGEYEHAIDAKQRLAIPAEVRAQLERAEQELVLYAVPGPNGAIWLWPDRTFQEIALEVDSSLLPEEDTMVFEELLFSQAARLEIDSAGRVRVPERLLRMAGIEGTATVLGVKDHLELREPKAWADRKTRVLLAEQGAIMMRARQARLARRRDDG